MYIKLENKKDIYFTITMFKFITFIKYLEVINESAKIVAQSLTVLFLSKDPWKE